MPKYAIQVPFDESWLYVTKDDPEDSMNRLIVTYDSEEEAKEAGQIWKQFRIIRFDEE